MIEFIVCVLAGLLAGFGTGFAGLSAAVFIAPMLITSLHVDSFTAIGVALASDVLASAASAITYYRNGNTALRKVRPLLYMVLAFAVVGTVISYIFTDMSMGEHIMGWWLLLAMLALGIKLLVFPANRASDGNTLFHLPGMLVMLLGGVYIGFVCGFQGTGGGLMLLFVMNIVLGIDFKKSVGSSVTIMSLTALIGAVSHFFLHGIPEIRLLVICVIFTFAGAAVAARIANRIDKTILKRLTGGLMTVAGVIMFIAKVV